MYIQIKRTCQVKCENVLPRLHLLTVACDVSTQELREIQEKKKRPLEEEADSQEIRMPSKKKKFATGKKKGKKFK